MNRMLQVVALCLSIGLLGFLACRAQSPQPAKNEAVMPAAPDAGAIDAAPPPEVYFPGSKWGGAFLEHQQGRR